MISSSLFASIYLAAAPFDQQKYNADAKGGYTYDCKICHMRILLSFIFLYYDDSTFAISIVFIFLPGR